MPDVTGLLAGVVDALDEPFADSSAIPTFAVAMSTARHVKVALSGIGGDEAFAGYPRYLGVRLARRYARLPHPLRNPGIDEHRIGDNQHAADLHSADRFRQIAHGSAAEHQPPRRRKAPRGPRHVCSSRRDGVARAGQTPASTSMS